MPTYLIIGTSMGLGDAFAKGVPLKGDTVWLIARSKPASLSLTDGVIRHWLLIDMATKHGISTLEQALGQQAIDVVIYNVGIWEERGFEDDYTFDADNPAFIATMISSNVTSAITYCQVVLPHVRGAVAGKFIFIGSTAGLNSANNKQVTFVASKYAVRSIAEAFREHVREDATTFTCSLCKRHYSASNNKYKYVKKQVM
ncbi:short chain dehydrogenase [Metalysinibacillus saudimassiliensis]|uniref:Short chain dehydrogenase n=1 Tax=Metalysinibacillus saudimassiliensis TaxID=1461583 RepID=A0A078MH77_9BACL|nr:short chain dehydrogenase [Metalysinibacillus saudimassiliensis]